jgi:hypothetical protein
VVTRAGGAPVRARLGAAWLATDRRVAWTTFSAAFAIYALTASWARAWNSDVEASIIPALQIARTGLPWLEGSPWESGSPFFYEAGDHVVSNRQIGIIMLAVPFYAVLGAPEAVWPSTLAVVTATAGTVTMLHLALRRVVRPSAALAATVVFAVGTPTWTVSADGLWSHTVTQLTIAAAAVAAARDRWWLVGAALGAGILARPHLAVVPLVLGLGIAWSRRSPRVAVAVGVPAACGLALLLLLNRWIYDRWTVTGYGSYPTDNLVEGVGGQWHFLTNVAGFLIAPDRGLFVWTPLALVLLPAVWRVRSSAPVWTVWLALGGVAYTVIQLRINLFHGVDAFFGYRHGLELVACAVPLYAVAWASVTSRVLRAVTAALAVLQAAAMLIGAVSPGGFLHVAQVWRDNSIAFMLREEPLVMGLFSLVAVTGAAAFGVWTYGRTPTCDATYQS